MRLYTFDLWTCLWRTTPDDWNQNQIYTLHTGYASDQCTCPWRTTPAISNPNLIYTPHQLLGFTQKQARSMQFLNGQAKKWVWLYSGVSRVGVTNTALWRRNKRNTMFAARLLFNQNDYWSRTAKLTTHCAWLGINFLAKTTFSNLTDRLFKK